MLSAYIRSAIRHFMRQKGFSAINVLGLAIGIAVSIVGFLYVNDQLSYDKFHKNASRIHRVAVDALAGNTAIYQTYTSAPMADAFYEFFPEVEKVARIRVFSGQTVECNERKFIEDRIFMVDSTFFDLFDFPVLYGNRGVLLNNRFTAVITRTTAERYFGSANPVGQEFRIGDDRFRIEAVVEDVPHNSHFHFDIVIGIISYPEYYESRGWFNNSYRTYLMLHSNADVQKVASRLPEYTDKYLFRGRYAENARSGNKWELYLQPLTSIHLNSDLRGEFEPNGRRNYVYIFLLVSAFILLIACINFINLSTAKSTLRAREVGIRKTVGAGRGSLMRQYLTESVITSFLALIIALVLVELVLSYLREYESVNLVLPFFTNIYTIPLLILFGLTVGLLAGFYPALVLSSYNPLRVLKHKPLVTGHSLHLRNGLVTFQFMISVFLIIGTFIIYRQLQLMQENDLGFDKENVLKVHHANVLQNGIQSFKNELLQLPGVETAAGVFRMPGSRFVNLGFGAEGMEDGFTLNLSGCDADYAAVIKPEIVKGRFFSDEYSTDSSAIVINEQAARLLGYDDPIGKNVHTWSDPPQYFHIIGVVRDFYYESRHNKVYPMGLVNVNSHFWIRPDVVAVRIKPGDYEQTIDRIGKVWGTHAPGIAFDYSFFDVDYDGLYANEMHTRKLFLAFSVLAVFIACLGLLGLASYLAQQKRGEIAVRKTFGATSASVSLMLSLNFTKWVALANLIAWPLSWYFFDGWLNNFAYRTPVAWWYFALAGLASLLIALLTVVYQTVKASLTNPAEALRYE